MVAWTCLWGPYGNSKCNFMVKDWLRFFAKKWGPAIGDKHSWLRHWYKMIGTFLKALKGTSLHGQINNCQIFMKHHLNHHDYRKQHVGHVVFNMSWTSFQQGTYLPALSPSPHPIPPGYVLHPIDRSCYHPQHKLHWNPAALPRHDLHQLKPLRVEFRWRGLGGPEPSNEWSCNHYKWP